MANRKTEAPTVLVVDDDRVTLRLMEVVLTNAGYRAILCADAKHACPLIRKWQPDLVILDLQLGDDADAGWRILAVLRLDPTTAQIPVLLCSGHGPVLRDRREVLRAMGCDLLEKPFDLKQLQAKIAHLIDAASGLQVQEDESG